MVDEKYIRFVEPKEEIIPDIQFIAEVDEATDECDGSSQICLQDKQGTIIITGDGLKPLLGSVVIVTITHVILGD